MKLGHFNITFILSIYTFKNKKEKLAIDLGYAYPKTPQFGNFKSKYNLNFTYKVVILIIFAYNSLHKVVQKTANL